MTAKTNALRETLRHDYAGTTSVSEAQVQQLADAHGLSFEYTRKVCNGESIHVTNDRPRPFGLGLR